MHYWSNTQGALEVRGKIVNLFMQHHGFEKLIHLLRAKRIGWMGAEAARILLQGALDARPPVGGGGQENGQTLVEGLCACFMEPLQSLVEEELKVDSFFLFSFVAVFFSMRT